MTYGEFREKMNNTYPESINHFGIGGKTLYRLSSWKDEELDALEIEDKYDADYYDQEKNERWFIATAKA